MDEEARQRFTLCWDCAKATGYCPWSSSLEPVKGWVVEQTKRTTYSGEIHSLIVYECPLFERDAYCSGLKRLGDVKHDTTRKNT